MSYISNEMYIGLPDEDRRIAKMNISFMHIRIYVLTIDGSERPSSQETYWK